MYESSRQLASDELECNRLIEVMLEDLNVAAEP